MNFEFIKSALLATAMPAAIYVIVVSLFCRPWKKNNTREFVQNSASILGLVGGYFFGYWSIKGLPLAAIPQDEIDWIFYLAVLGIVCGLAANLSRKWIYAGLLLAMAGAASFVMVQDWTVRDNGDSIWLYRGCFVAAVLTLLVSLQKICAVFPARFVPIFFTVWATAVSGMLMFSANARFAQMAGIFAAIFGTIFVLSFFHSAFALSKGTLANIAMLLTGLIATGYFTKPKEIKTSLLYFAMTLASPLLIWLILPRWQEHLRKWKFALAFLAVFLIFVGIALGIAFTEYQSIAASSSEPD